MGNVVDAFKGFLCHHFLSFRITACFVNGKPNPEIYVKDGDATSTITHLRFGAKTAWGKMLLIESTRQYGCLQYAIATLLLSNLMKLVHK